MIMYVMKENNKNNQLIYLLLLMIMIGCNSKEERIDSNDEQISNTLTSKFDFPNEVYTNRKYKGRVTFYNPTFDTIVEPRIDTVKFRYIIYKPFETVESDEFFLPVFKDSVLLENNTIDIELEFNKPGVYNIGGAARDVLMIGYYSGNIRDSVRLRENTVLMIKKVIVKDSI